jgi:sugar phosphate isomerase/epimerase
MIKLGLYSITYLGVWYRGRALTIEETVARAKEYGYAGLEIDGKRPHGNPLDLTPERCRELRRRAEDSGVDIYAVAANNDFSSPIPEHRESQLAYVRELVRMTKDLGAPVLRVFAAWPGVTLEPGRYDVARGIWTAVHEPFASEQTWAWCRDGLIEASRWAEDAGVMLALQNHPPVIENLGDMLRMIDEIGSPALKACYDAPLASKQGARDMRQAVRDVGSRQVLSHFGGEYSQDGGSPARGFVRQPDGLVPEDFYPDFIRGLRDIGYDGYLGYELCHPLPNIDGQTVGIDFVDRNARLAAEYLRGLLAAVNDPALRTT